MARLHGCYFHFTHALLSAVQNDYALLKIFLSLSRLEKVKLQKDVLEGKR